MGFNRYLIDIFKAIIQVNEYFSDQIGIENNERLLYEIIKIFDGASPEEVEALKQKEDIKNFIIQKLKDKGKQVNNIVLIDRYTSQTLLKPLLTKNIFSSSYNDLKTREEILKKALEANEKENLEIEEIRELLAKAGEYKYNGYYIRDYKDYVIGFSATLYLDFLKKTEINVINEVSKKNEEYEKSLLDQTLRKLKLYKLAHKLAYAILGEVFLQKKYKDLEISKKRILELLGYKTTEKQIYQDIKESIFSLRWLEFVVWDYTKIDKRAKKRDYARGITVGSFLNTLTEFENKYIIDVNEKFVGCIQYVIDKSSNSNKEKLNYFSYPLETLSSTKNYSDSAYFLNDFLIRESGNFKLNTDTYKVISYKIEKYILESNIHYSRKNENYRVFLKTLKEIKSIQKTQPTFEELEKLKPSKAISSNLKIWLKKTKK